MPDESPLQILRLKDASSSPDASAVFFTLETFAGDARLALPAKDIDKMLVFFAGMAEFIGRRLGEIGKTEFNLTEISPIPVTGIGFLTGRTPDTTLLTLNVSGHPLAFEMPKGELARMADELGRIARTLSAEVGHPN